MCVCVYMTQGFSCKAVCCRWPFVPYRFGAVRLRGCGKWLAPLHDPMFCRAQNAYASCPLGAQRTTGIVAVYPLQCVPSRYRAVRLRGPSEPLRAVCCGVCVWGGGSFF